MPRSPERREGSEDELLAQALAAQVWSNRDRAEQSDGAVAFQARAANQVLAVPRDQHRAEVCVYACGGESTVCEERTQGGKVCRLGRCDFDDRRIGAL